MNPILSHVNFRWATGAAFTGVLLLSMVSVQAAKNPDKPEKPDKIEKRLERMDRSNGGSSSDRPSKSDRRSDRSSSDRSSSDRSDRSDRKAFASSGSSSSSSGSNGPMPQLDAFRIIAERNIFNPNRVGRSRNTEEAPPKVDSIALVGTMQTDDKLLAFFDSNNAAYRKALSEGQTVAGFTIKKITANTVELAHDDTSLSVNVSQQIRRVDEGDWKVTARDPVRVENPAPAPTAAPAIPNDASEVLRRLMEQRQNQLKQ